MDKRAVPTLSSEGFVFDVAGRLDHLMVFFFTNEYSQSLLYNNSIASLQYLIQENNQDTVKLRIEVKSTLERYLGAYFDTVSVVVTTDAVDVESSTYTLSIDVDVASENNTYNLGQEISIINSKMVSLAEKLNG